jgi:hypothetical protein
MTDPLADFIERASFAAQAVGLSCDVRSDLAASDFRGGSGEDVLRGANLPLAVAARTLGRVPVLFGQLPDAPVVALVREAVRRYRNQGVVARSHLSPEQALDLQLWLLGPPGSDEDAEWKALALAVERDDRVARKLVWRPPASESDLPAAFSVFVRRTFLARPWISFEQRGPAALDRASGLHDLAADLPIRPDVINQWFALAGSDDFEDGPELVDALIEAWPERAS